MLRLMRVRKGFLLVAGLLVAVVSGASSWQLARDAGAFGCGYENREHVAVMTLTAPRPSHIRVRIGDGLRLAVPGAGLRDVRVSGDAGLAPGTQNGVDPNRDYVFTVAGSGEARVTGIAAGREVSGRVAARC